MTPEKRKFTRVDTSIIVEFNQARKGAEHFRGLTRNFSCEGFSFEAMDFNYELNETLEVKLKFLRKGTFITVLGDVMWKKAAQDRYMTGIKLKDMSSEIQKEFLERISEYGNFSVSRFFSQEDFSSLVEEKINEDFPAEPSLTKEYVEIPLTKGTTPGIEKHYLNEGSSCLVSFKLTKEAAPEAQKVTITGDFNDWNKENIVMKKLKNGDFTVTLTLKANREYRFRYLIDGERWENDWNADRYDSNEFGWHDSVVIV